jgi:eukaryotic-like serine/threonine-protein kinase
MNAERWHRIEELFDHALKLPESQRNHFLDEECAGDPELLQELRVLLASLPAADASLREAIVAGVETLVGNAITAHVGRRIGHYRLIQLLGEGGMGAVYLAQRDDAQFNQRVAIKILSHAVGSPEAIARFRDERQILAGLEHPSIVRLFDGGSSDDNLPYLVMEHIEGMAITRYADEHELSVRARVELIRRVCAALQYAHQNLIVHRDIKPSNILVDADGDPKILDFGIAKLLAPVASFTREARTRTGAAMFTPEYASPEQARGDAVSTATDVYSLGAVLYELMAGMSPHRTTGSALEILRIISEVDPPRPSVVAPGGRRRELVGDLDNIIQKALHKEAALRYASMEQLSEDLGRWLDGLPIMARISTFGYRARKFVRRNKAVVVATTLVAATLVAATVVSLRQAEHAIDALRRATEAAERAERETNRARAAEAQVQALLGSTTLQLESIKSEQAARAEAKEEARAKRIEAEQSREQLQIALTKAKHEKMLAEQESARARAAEARAQAAVLGERETHNEMELREREHARALDEASKKIITVLP